MVNEKAANRARSAVSVLRRSVVVIDSTVLRWWIALGDSSRIDGKKPGRQRYLDTYRKPGHRRIHRQENRNGTVTCVT
jgi:hypothetical protein